MRWTKADGRRLTRRRSNGKAQVCSFQVSKDQLWNFTWRHTGPKGGPPIDIHGKGHFLRECRKRNLKWVGQDDIRRRGELMTPTQSKHDIKALIKEHGRAIVDSARQKARKEGVAWGS